VLNVSVFSEKVLILKHRDLIKNSGIEAVAALSRSPIDSYRAAYMTQKNRG
jgi:hypothetical protein